MLRHQHPLGQSWSQAQAQAQMQTQMQTPQYSIANYYLVAVKSSVAQCTQTTRLRSKAWRVVADLEFWVGWHFKVGLVLQLRRVVEDSWVRAHWARSVHDFHQILQVFNTAMEAKPSGKNLQVVNTAMCSQQPNRSLECWISLMFNTSEEGVEQWQQQLGADELDSGWPTPNMLSLIWYASGEI